MGTNAALAILSVTAPDAWRRKPCTDEFLRREKAYRGKDRASNARQSAVDSSTRQVQTSRHETDAYDPLWDGPRLVPAFVAQILGQCFAPAGKPDSVAPYEPPRPEGEHVIDIEV
jgi:hypothetical protein